MYRIVFAVTLMVFATAGAADGQDVTSDRDAAVATELRRAAAADRQNAVTATAGLVDELRNAVAARVGQQAVLPVAVRQGLSGLSIATGDPVSYSISGRLADGASSSSPLPMGIVAAIRADSHLKSMNVGSGAANSLRLADGAAVLDDRPTFSAAFGFENLEEFHAWYSAQGEALHRAIDGAGAEDVRFNLSVVPE